MSHFQNTTNSYSLNDSANRAVSKHLIETPVLQNAQVLTMKGGNDVLKQASSSNLAVQPNLDYFSSNKFTFVTSPCPLMPSFLSSAHFYCGETDFNKITEFIRSVLFELTEKHNYSWKYFDREYMWRAKYIQGSKSREMQINCFYDSQKADHVLDFIRIKGDAIIQDHDFVGMIRSKFASAPSSSCPRRQRRVVKPLPAFICEDMTPEDFKSGAEYILDSCKDLYYESRYEATKMLYDLCTSHSETMLTLEDFMSSVLQVIEGLVSDDFDEIREMLVFIVSKLVEMSQYSDAIAHNESILSFLLDYVRDVNPTEEDYQTIHMRHQASVSFAKVLASSPSKVLSFPSLVNKIQYVVMQQCQDMFIFQQKQHIATIFGQK